MESRPAKVRGTFLPNEYLLANFIRGIENPHPSWTTDTPACKWMGAYCYIENEVHALIWTELKLQGTVEWKYLPSTLRNFGLQRNKLRGGVDFSVLPEALTKMLIGNNCSREHFVLRISPHFSRCWAYQTVVLVVTWISLYCKSAILEPLTSRTIPN